MISLKIVRNFLVGTALVAAPAMSHAVGLFVSVNIAPPVLPVYTQPAIPAEGYIWTPGYWAYGPDGYYWVPGVWVMPPHVGVLWTPGYWGFAGGAYGWHEGYWGPHVGFYGGVNYGFGYGGIGFAGGEWRGGAFAYNSAVVNFGGFHPANVYVNRTVVVNNTIINNNHVSFNGGAGIQAHASAAEMQASHEQHFQPTSNQTAFRNTAASNPAQRASVNGGHPSTLAAQTPRDGFGHGNEVNSRQGNQQARITNGVHSGQLTPGETKNLENRDSSINHQATADRTANGGKLTGQEKQQINQRQNNVSHSINQDAHNANNDKAAAARHNEAPHQEKKQAEHVENHERPER